MNKTSRRAVLRGLGGFCVALPFLELFAPRRATAASPSAPQRYMIAFGGTSIGMESRDFVVPTSEGPLAGNLTRGLGPLGDHGVDDVTSIVSGMKIPWGSGANIPSAGRAVRWHSMSVNPMLTGMKSPDDDDEKLQGPTSDWSLSELLAGPTAATRPVLSYRVQAAYYRGSNGTGGNRGLMSARMNGGNLERITPQFSPQVAYQDLFSGFIPPDPAEAEKAKRLLNRRKSVIDLVSADAERLTKRLGAADRIRMQQHFDELRGLEKRLEAVPLPDGSACKVLPDPGSDPAVGGAVENGDTGGYAGNGAWSDEELRAQVMVDLIHMAFVCDLSRVASLMFTFSQCFLNMNPVFGYPSDLHELGHYSVGGGDKGANAVADGVAWHVKHFARLAQKLRDSQDVDGRSILDNTAMILCFEGGWGYDPEQDRQGTTHSSENMIMIATGKGGGLNASGGKHIRAQNEHPAKVLTTVMQALGGPSTLGQVSGTIPGLVG
ncbi:MAG: DUF1552 domain-containing protein [Polyangiaceae bacterium]